MSESFREHAKYGASSAHRWMKCHASIKLAETLPTPPASQWATDGTEAHKLLEFALKNKYRSAREASIMADRSDDEDRCDAVQIALDYVYDILDTHSDALLFVEKRFKFPSVVTNDAFGTNDILIVIPDLELMHVIDYKHGAGIPVEVHENKQLLVYGTGAYFNEEIPKTDTLVLTIIQPRAFHPLGPIREWTIGFERLETFLDEFDQAVLECESESAAFNPGKEQCKWCPALLNCKAIEEKSLQIARQDFNSVKQVSVKTLPDPGSIPVDRLAYIMQSADLLRQWLSEVEDYAYQHATQGGYVPGFKLVEAQAKRVWYGKDEEIAAQLMLLAGASIDEVMPRKLINITSADKLVKEAFKKRDETVKAKDAAEAAKISLAKLTIKDTSGKLSLVPDTDRRPAAQLGSDAFKGVQVLPTNNQT